MVGPNSCYSRNGVCTAIRIGMAVLKMRAIVSYFNPSAGTGQAGSGGGIL